MLETVVDDTVRSRLEFISVAGTGVVTTLGAASFLTARAPPDPGYSTGVASHIHRVSERRVFHAASLSVP
jgi:hypothetical protein